MSYKLEIFSPIPGKGLNREYVASEEIQNESNYIELGLIVWDEMGVAVDGVVVQVECTDPSQNQEMNGTGTVSRYRACKYYPFHYEFKTPENHVITFKVGDESISVSMNAR